MMCEYCPQTLIGSVAKKQNLNEKCPLKILNFICPV